MTGNHEVFNADDSNGHESEAKADNDNSDPLDTTADDAALSEYFAEDEPVKCKLCDQSFDTQEDLNEHKETAHNTNASDEQNEEGEGEGEFKCVSCGARFATSNEWSDHLRDEHLGKKKSSQNEKIKKSTIKRPARPSSSDDGGGSRRKKSKTVIENGDGDSQLECEECGGYFASKEKMDLHIRREHDEHSDNIDNGDNSDEDLVDHEIADDDEIYFCQACGSTFMDSDELEEHIDYVHSRQIVKKKPKKSKRKSSKFNSAPIKTELLDTEEDAAIKSSLQDKVIRVGKVHVPIGSALKSRGGPTEEWKCEVCGDIFGTRSSLALHHKWIHEKGSQVVCKECLKVFYNPRHLKEHIFQCHQDMDLTCRECGRLFSNQSNLRKHVSSIHDRVRPFKCKLCPKTYASYADAKKHVMKLHDKTEEDNLTPFINDTRDVKVDSD